MSAPFAVSPVTQLSQAAAASNTTVKFTPIVNVEVVSQNAQNFQMAASLTTGKAPTKTGFSYSLGWSTVVNRNSTIVQPNQIVQQWFSPRWNSANLTGGYANFYCQASVSATNVTTQTYGLLATNGDLVSLSANRTAAQTISSPVSTPITFGANSTVFLNGTWTNSGAWQSYNCIGGRSDVDGTTGLAQQIKVGQTISWDAGFKVYNNATATTTISQGTSPIDFTYTLVDAGVMTALCATIALPIIAGLF